MMTLHSKEERSAENRHTASRKIEAERMLLTATYWRLFAACLSASAVYLFVGKVAKTLRGDGVVDATGETAARLGFVSNCAVMVGIKVLTDLGRYRNMV